MKKIHINTSAWDSGLTLFFMIVAHTMCFAFYRVQVSQVSAASMTIFILAVLLISWFTTGYRYGLISAAVSTFSVNYFFTYPYAQFTLRINGYTKTFLTLFAVSSVVCMLTAKIKEQSKIKAEIENEKIRINFLRSISHDIRTPLTSIIGSSSAFLENDNLTEDAKNTLISDIKCEAEWLMRMVENILSITRVTNAQACLDKKPEMIEEIIGETTQKFRKKFPGITLSVSVPNELLFVPADATLIEQVILNMLENAAYHGETTTRINISVLEDDSFITVRISDNGVGINESSLENINNSDFTINSSSTTDKRRNIGIGLSVCKYIIKAHGGKIVAYNSPNGGAVFEFTLPLSRDHDASQDEQPLG